MWAMAVISVRMFTLEILKWHIASRCGRWLDCNCVVMGIIYINVYFILVWTCLKSLSDLLQYFYMADMILQSASRTQLSENLTINHSTTSFHTFLCVLAVRASLTGLYKCHVQR